MMVPTGSALRATSTFGPTGTAGVAAAACGLLGTGSSKHVLGHDCGDCRDDQRSDEQHDLLNVHGEIASPWLGPQ